MTLLVRRSGRRQGLRSSGGDTTLAAVNPGRFQGQDPHHQCRPFHRHPGLRMPENPPLQRGGGRSSRKRGRPDHQHGSALCPERWCAPPGGAGHAPSPITRSAPIAQAYGVLIKELGCSTGRSCRGQRRCQFVISSMSRKLPPSRIMPRHSIAAKSGSHQQLPGDASSAAVTRKVAGDNHG